MGRGRNGGQARRGGNTLMQRLLQKHVTDIFEELQPLPADAAEQAEAVYSVLSQRHKDKFHQPREKLLPQIDQVLGSIRSIPSSEEEGEEEGGEEDVPLVQYKNHNLLNSSLYSSYQETSRTTTDTPDVGSPASQLKKRKASSDAGNHVAKRSKKAARASNAPGKSSQVDMSHTYSLPEERYGDLGGIDELLADIRELIEWPLLHPEIYAHLGVSPPVGVLLHGPPGCGKTLLAQAIGGELGRPFYKISAPEIVSGMSGESEAKLRSLFLAAQTTAPSIIFIDEIDTIAPKRETATREMEKRIVAQLFSCMDEVSAAATTKGPVMVIGATNRPQVLDSALRRAGRFDRELALGVPNIEAREKILRVLYRKLRVSGEFDFPTIAQQTPGYVGADLAALTKESAVAAIHRVFHSVEKVQQIIGPTGEDAADEDVTMSLEEGSAESRNIVSDRLRTKKEPLSTEQLDPLAITMEDVLRSIKRVQPSAKREGFATVPNVTWDDVGALKNIREELNLTIVENIKQSEIFKRLGLTDPTGVLLYGPPGCGKTLLAKAIANDANANFISVKGPELLNKYVGESERAVRGVFQRARSSAPCIVFFDELDALCPKRSSDSSSSSHSSERVVNQLLTEMDGLEERKNVYIVAATNRPDIIDSAMLRPGRLDKLIYVPLPTIMERKDILETLSKNRPMHESIDMLKVACDPRCERFSGADLSSLVREACLECLREYLRASPGEGDVFVHQHHFDAALSKIGPSVSKRDEMRYNRLRQRFDSFRLEAAHQDDPLDDNADDTVSPAQ